jgi:hypothetical protein
VVYFSGFKVLESEGLPGVLRSIRETISARKANFLVVDGLVTAEEVAPSDTAFKKFIHEIQQYSSMFKCTIVLITNDPDEAILLADRVIPLTAAPNATLGPSIPITLPQPRDRKTIAEEPEFRRIRLTRFGIGGESRGVETNDGRVGDDRLGTGAELLGPIKVPQDRGELSEIKGIAS